MEVISKVLIAILTFSIFLVIFLMIYLYRMSHHRYARKISRRSVEIIESLENGTKLSGAYIRQRPAFGNLIIRWFLPLHQSIEVKNKNDNTRRHIGLDGALTECTFRSHEGPDYDWLNEKESLIPVECWTEFYDNFGFYPDINIEDLNVITQTPAENPDKHYKTKYLGFYKFCDTNQTTAISTCRSAIMSAVLKAHFVKLGTLKLDDVSIIFTDNRCTFCEYVLSCFRRSNNLSKEPNMYN